MRAAVVGAGPAGLYAARALLSRYPSLHVDLLDRLPTPFGLIRYGVSPDHPHTKNAIAQFSNFIRQNRSRLSFLGNVPAGPATSLPYPSLTSLYHITIIATGAFAPRKLQGIEVPLRGGGVFGAHLFAQWMNGHPEIEEHLRVELEERILQANEVCVVGMGNVALDVARILLRNPSEFADTDVSERALSILQQAAVRRVTVMGRRGPEGAKWTTAALRELMTRVEGVETECEKKAVEYAMEGQVSRSAKRMLKLLKEGSVEKADGGKVLRLTFGRSPKAFGVSDEGMVEMGVRVAENEEEVQQSDAVFLSLGYESGRGEGNRVGWANGTARGIIGDNRWDAEEVVRGLPDISEGTQRPGLEGWLRDKGIAVVTWEGWERIDAEERRRGHEAGRATGRIKIESIAEMLEVAQAAPPK
eukprot:GFKZ01002638.1.p1 GENE.GFKZ01002638.1~~GFKZ01002638.1.p1  ORF type:complete len:416 (+),score=66.26 GFKZ01002638.1:479-1726(+)